MAFNSIQNYLDAQAVTPSDAALNQYFGLYVGVTGDVTVITKAAYTRSVDLGNAGSAGTATLFKSVPAGVIIPVQVALVKATGTTATQIVGLGPT